MENLYMQISHISKYDPLDLFAGSKDRIQKAIKALFLTPQNNFRVFLNGTLCFGGMGGATDNTSCTSNQSFIDGLKSVISAKDGMHTEYFRDLIAETVFNSRLLDRLLEVQKLDTIDIEGVIHAYYDIVSKPCLVCKNKGAKLSTRYSTVHSMLFDEKLKVVRDYLISATAKDLSMMISFMPKRNNDLDSPHEFVFLKSSQQAFYYKVDYRSLNFYD